ncbi:MAG: hypothetical protein LPH21_08980 [Shewanella sp.]|nr:hypothetical protein [Shewanella sp.]MCF1429495.1 hypothetical protein [Shewanella sp.]MCF1457678.1 hypothetical protein [Shewanella sp.]
MQWEVDGSDNNYLVRDGSRIALDRRFGFPTGAGTPVTDATLDDRHSG